MTRINVGIDPYELPDKQLLAEHREIKRIPNKVTSGRFNLVGCPTRFTLGVGHVRFFYRRLGYLLRRYISLYLECRRRGFRVQCHIDAWRGIPVALMGHYKPSIRDRELLLSRFLDKGIYLYSQTRKTVKCTL